MLNFEDVIGILDYALNSRRRRHITGGILLSVSMLFAGLALTALTLRPEEEETEAQNEQYEQ